jgi:hypothetical protein
LREEKAVLESARKHGPFDERYRVRQKLPAASWDLRLNEDGGDRLEWSAFLARCFPNRRRHDFEALAAYEAYRNTLEPGTAQQRPTLPALPGRRNGRSRNRQAAAPANGRVPVAASSAAVLAWESEGGASAERPAANVP